MWRTSAEGNADDPVCSATIAGEAPALQLILVRLNEEVAKVVRAPALHKRFLERGVELKASASPEEFTAHIKAEVEKKGKLARDAGIKLE